MIELLNGYGKDWAESFGWAVAQNTVFLGLVFVVLYVLRNASARVKYAVAAIGLVKLVLPPFVPARLFAPAAGQSIQETTSTLLFSFTNNPVGTAVPAKGFPIGLDAFGVVFLIWTGAALILLGHSIFLTVRLARTVAGSVPVEGDGVLDALDAAAPGKVHIYKSDRIGMPLTIGIFPRRVYVPAAWDTWTPECRAVVLKHELAHIRRRDGLFQTLEIAVQAVYFFHPLVLILNRRLREYREMACDDASVGSERMTRLGYSKFLLELAETALRPPVVCESASALIRRKNELFKRVAYQVKEGNMHFVSKKRMAVVLAAMLLAVVPFSMYLDGGDQAVAGGKKNAARQASLDLVLQGDQIICCGEDMSKAKFADFAKKVAQAKGEEAVFHIDCKGDVPMAMLYDVQKTLIENNLTKVSYANGANKALPMVLPSDEVRKKMQHQLEEDVVFVFIEYDGTVLVNKKKIPPEKLTKYIEKRLSSNPKTVVSIHASGKTRYDDFVTVLADVKKAGADKVFISNPS